MTELHGIILHEEYRERMRKLSPEKLGMLIENMFRVDAGEEVEVFGDEYLDFLSETICGRVERDIKLSDRQRANGMRGGARVGNQNATKSEPKTTQNQTKNNPKSNQKQTPITNNQLPITNTNTNTNNIPLCQEVMNYLNEKAGKNLRLTDPNIRLISARSKEGYTLADFKCVIDKKCKKWLKDEKMKQYLKPSTLFAPSHFDDYLNEPVEEDKDDMLERWANSDETGVFADYTEVESSVPRLLS